MEVLLGTRILFYVPGMDVINDGVYYSQVFALGRYAVSLGAKCLVVNTSEEEPDVAEFSRDGVDVIRCAWDKTYTPLSLMPRKYRRATKPAEERMTTFAPTHIYVRDPTSGYVGISFACKLRVKLLFSRRGAGDQPVHFANGRKARAEMGWEPVRFGVETIIQDAWAFHSCCGRS